MTNIQKVDLHNGIYTYSSYAKAGGFIFTSICSGNGKNVTEAVRNALDGLREYLNHAGADLCDLVKVTVTFKRSENFQELKAVFKEYFNGDYPARNTILVDEFLGDMILQIEGIAYKP